MASVSAGKVVIICGWGMNTEPVKLALFQIQITYLSNVFY